MKKYLILSFLFLLTITPVLAKTTNETQGQQAAVSGSQSNTSNGSQNAPTQKPDVSATGNQVKNTNVLQIQNMGEDQKLSVKTQETEQLNQDLVDSLTKVSDQVLELIETVGAKNGIGQQVKAIAQDQSKLQQEIKSDVTQLNSRGAVSKFLIGSDKKLIKSMEQKMEQNRLVMQQLEELKTQTQNQADLKQLQLTIDLMTYQNTSLQNKLEKESKSTGVFSWLVDLFNR